MNDCRSNIINTALGGNGTWPEKAKDPGYPCTFEIDYVRFYTKKDFLKNYKSAESKPSKGTKKSSSKKKKKGSK